VNNPLAPSPPAFKSQPPQLGNVVALKTAAANGADPWRRLTFDLLMKQNAEGGIHPAVLEAILTAAGVAP
jgi:hypothetical protein